MTARERVFGGPVYLYAYDRAIRGRRKRALGFRVRDAAGDLIPEHVTQAKRHALELSNRLIQGAGPAAQTTLGQLFALFEREVVPRERPKTREESQRGLALWRAFLGERFVLSKLGLREWNAFFAARQAGEIDGRGRPVKPTKRRVVRPRTVARSLKLLRQVCRFGASYRTATGAFLLENDPTRGLPVPVETNPRRPVADTARFEALLAVGDRVMMLEHAIYTVASPEAAASILWRDPARAIDAATSMKITAQDLKSLGVIDVIITEPVGGAHRDTAMIFKQTAGAIAGALTEFSGMSADAIREQRQEKFLQIGRSL